MTWALTLGALARGVPFLPLAAGADGGMVERSARVTGSTSGSRRGLCSYGASFGHWYAPGGSICRGHPSVAVLVGTTVEMEGHGNGWATRITRVAAIAPVPAIEGGG